MVRDFTKSTVRALAKSGITLLKPTVIPGTGDMPWANGSTGYEVNDNGCHRIWTFNQVLEAAKI